MEFRDLLLNYIIPIAGMALALGVYLFFSGRKGIFSSDKREEKVEARIYDNTNRTVYNANIPVSDIAKIKEEHGSLGRKWLRDGKWLFAFNKTTDGKYRPVVPPFDMKNPPSKVHRALTQHAAAIVFDVQVDKGFMQKYLPILIWSGIIIFIMWMAVAD